MSFSRLLMVLLVSCTFAFLIGDLYAFKIREHAKILPKVLVDHECRHNRSSQLDIEHLREVAKESLGRRFDQREFNKQVQKTTSVSLPVFRRQVMAWVEEKNAAYFLMNPVLTF